MYIGTHCEWEDPYGFLSTHCVLGTSIYIRFPLHSLCPSFLQVMSQCASAPATLTPSSSNTVVPSIAIVMQLLPAMSELCIPSFSNLAVTTRPDIAYVVGVLCRFVENPGEAHWNAAKRVLRYLKGTVDMSLAYSGSSSPDLFTAFSDADLGGNLDNSHSTGGFAICIGGGAVQWGSRLHPHVLLSSTKSEYTTVSKVGCEVMWTRYLLGEFGYDISCPSLILVDNASAIQVAKHPEHQSTMKHVHRAYHWIRDHVERGDISVTHVPGSENPADIFTKPLGRIKFAKFRGMLGLRD